MKSLSIEGLPSESATAEKKKVKTRISNNLNTIRHEIKEVISQSTKSDTKRACFITSIAKTLSQKGKIEITMKFLQRLALLRTWLKDLPAGTDEDAFWKFADEKLQKYAERYASKPGDYKRMLEGILKHDVQTYPRQDKEDDIESVIVPTDRIPQNQKVAMKLARGGVVTANEL
ncbi:hypothetical protein M422DRAFT_262590 [Sphaerobolus stellatus SS14]|uniref:Uncharacterized protein n=1 Tax=Sphaerobolus stellatus (strain SS14) TaxID=990650 RepID=A0A0C9UK10_SPHS4|nr:hypothetical protein M422DRAFT_262590 [Sphaerobolus stellatus SS14]